MESDGGARMRDYDILGKGIPQEQQLELQRYCFHLLGLNPHQEEVLASLAPQPMLLDARNFHLLRQKHYRATWKAVGTRYMMLLMSGGCYMVDHQFNFRWVHMRFPLKNATAQAHHLTLLDGEMVIDKDPATGRRYRRYLVSDLLVLNNKSLINEPFSERWELVYSDVIEPRKIDASAGLYNYDMELFHVRRKDYWPLSAVERILSDLVPNQLSHAADGLIFQEWEAAYVPWKDPRLLKWKYPHTNSVNFLLTDMGCLQLWDKSKRRNVVVEGRVTFPETMSPWTCHNRIIQCWWNPCLQMWQFLQVRNHKRDPDSLETYSIMRDRILHHIPEDVLVGDIWEMIRPGLEGAESQVKTSCRSSGGPEETAGYTGKT